MPTFNLQTIEPCPEAFIEAVLANPIDVETPILLQETRSKKDLAAYIANLSPAKKSLIEENVAYSEELAARIGIKLLGKGSDRTVFHDTDTNVVYKFAYKSKDPVNDCAVEKMEIALCEEYYPSDYNIPTKPELVTKTDNRIVLLSAQYLIHLAEKSSLELPGDFMEASARLYRDRGLCLDGSAAQETADGRFVILDTTLAPTPGVVGEQNPKSSHWPGKSWRPIGMTDSDMPTVEVPQGTVSFT